MDGEGVVGVINDKSRCTSIRFFYILLLEIVNLNFVILPSLGIIAG